MDLALGEFGLTRERVERMSWADFWRTAYGYWIREDRQWDRTRNIMALLYNSNRSRRQPYRKPKQLYPLVIDRLGKKTRQWTQSNYEKFDRALIAWGLKEPEDVQEYSSTD